MLFFSSQKGNKHVKSDCRAIDRHIEAGSLYDFALTPKIVFITLLLDIYSGELRKTKKLIKGLRLLNGFHLPHETAA